MAFWQKKKKIGVDILLKCPHGSLSHFFQVFIMREGPSIPLYSKLEALLTHSLPPPDLIAFITIYLFIFFHCLSMFPQGRVEYTYLITHVLQLF